ncbi:helix-turn-helix transcriptional regulator [Algoriphagus sp. H41]|uniref:Helix-turn-helix transcriptional regulator n=1 Tax=Algoriphagus oliviformis TaxID=2811231 RepID=A0ABS3C3H3_9BACT|nr:XRE family transcriptional regulator [Algoriphagus oliviformis]MBN7811662.1 helix-turn-helix transcriptional regulator [Algoriphagus oliviformis]
MNSSDYLTVQIGNKIKSIRKEKGWRLGELAEKSGMSIAMVSKIENGRIIPTLPSLIQLIQAFDLGVADFFSDLKSENDFSGYILRKKSEYTQLNKEEESIGYEYQMILNYPIEKSSMEITLLTLKSGAEREPVSTAGFEYLYILRGKIRYCLGSETFDLEEGDSLFFDGNIPHVPKNETQSDAELLVTYLISMG